MPKLQEAIRWRLIWKLIVDWIEESTFLPRDHIIKGRQNANHPIYPAATFNLISGPHRRGIDDAQVDSSVGTGAAEKVRTQYQGPRPFTVSILMEVGPEDDANSNPDCDANALMTAALADLRSITRREQTNRFGLALVRTNPVLDISEVLNGEFVSRASMDVEFSTQSVFVDPIDRDFIENLSAIATYEQDGLADIVIPVVTSN